uniref:NADH:ubiquinone reductase (H(+)-translocating) n=1 Tax=Cubaia aphrodite TaxID=1104540 RepID=G9ISN3_CUBAP|nr:NADH dehydrogenase subunit 2 [Cubaia aphrodite]AER54532.1 NADH dehydrogenase subunit 2 [Cubaia aphrodite]
MEIVQYEIILSLLILSLLLIAGTKWSRWTFFSFLIITMIFIGQYQQQDWHLYWWINQDWRWFLKGLLIVSGLATWSFIDSKDIHQTLLWLLTLTASFLLIACEHLLAIYLILELQTFSLFVLIARNRNSMLSTEAGLKYFILGAISSALFLLGVSLRYGVGITLQLNHQNLLLAGGLTETLSTGLILMALLFKLTAVPFHMWAPDVYEGATVPIVVLIATVPKISVLSLFIHINVNHDIILWTASLSMIIGTLGAINQTKLKRFVAYSGISHMGFLLFGIALYQQIGLTATYLYLLIYVVMVVITFGLIWISPRRPQLLVETSALIRWNPILGLSWAVLFLSLAGIPPLAGFISKWMVLWMGLQLQYYLLAIIGIVCSMVAGAYYLRVVKFLYFQKNTSYLIWEQILEPENKSSFNLSLWLGIGLFLLTALIIHPTPLVLLCHWSTLSLF